MQRFLGIYLMLGIIFLGCKKEHWGPVSETRDEQVQKILNSGNGPSREAVCLLPIEEMPFLLTCSHLETRSERRKCSDFELKKIISENLRYPSDAGGYEGMIVVSFTIYKNGSRSNPKIIRGGPPSINAEVMRLVGLFPPFHPGSFLGKPTQVQFNLPIRFPWLK